MLPLAPLLLACARPPPPTPAADPPAIEVLVREDPAGDAWSVTYTFPEPVAGLWWTRTRNQFRAGSWGGEAVAAARWGEYAAADEDRRVFTLTFDTDTGFKPKDYELNLAFSEGSRLLYTGHLRAAAMARTEDGLQRQDPLPMRWRFETADGRTVRAGDEVGRGALSTGDLQDIYVFLGDLEPVAGERAAAIIDPAMPAWMVEATRDFVPELFAYYARATGVELDFTPTLLLSYTPGDPDQESYGGGGLHRQMQLAASGGAWAEQTAERRRAWLWFLAHESFHMWNGQRFRTRGGQAEEWLSEGSASYLADLALLDLGVDDGPRFEQAVRDHASACLRDLGDEPLRSAHVQGRYRAFYSCGAAVLFVTDHQLRAAGSDLGALLGGMFRQGAERGGWSTWDLLEGIEAATGDPMGPAFVMRSLESGLNAESLEAALAATGLPVAVAPLWAGETPGRVLLKALAGRVGDCDCGGSVSADVGEAAVSFRPLAACDVLAEGLAVMSMAGVSLDEPAAALAAMEARIAAGEPVSLNGEVALDCAGVAPLPPCFVAP